MRQRIEDLGRLAVLLQNLLEQELFAGEGRFRPLRPKDTWDWFQTKTDDEKEDILRSWAYGIEAISEKVYEMLSIAEGTDPLNERVDE